MIFNVFAVFVGGGLGAALRYLTSVFCTRLIPFALPVSTFCVNFIGSFILGITFAIFLQKFPENSSLKIAVMVGFCGGLTTFSTFSFELFEMLKNGNYILAVFYSLLSIVFCLLAVFLGIKLGKCF